MPFNPRRGDAFSIAAAATGTLTLTSDLTSLPAMKTWPVQDAKARFSEMLETCLKEGPQLVTKRGSDAAVLVPAEQWRKVENAAKPTLKELLLGERVRGDMKIPPRGRLRRRNLHPFS